MSKYVYGYLVGLSTFGKVFSGSPAAPSPSAETELICRTENTADCYPRIFQPTEDFQLVREGQDLPPGLHVRLNVWTGEKEARLNIPTEDDVRLEDLSIERSVIIVDQPDQHDFADADIGRAMRDQASGKPPLYEVAGKIVPPREPGSKGGDNENFMKAIGVLEEESPAEGAVNLALSILLDLAHDIYYGVELVKRGGVLEQIIGLMSSDSNSQRQQAASILGGSIQNNPTALKEALAAWKAMYQDKTLIQKLQQTLVQETDPSATGAEIFALMGLTKDLNARNSFLNDAGMELLLTIFLKEGEQWTSTRRKIAQFVMDTFLDQDMGAELGVWPTRKQDSMGCDEAECATNDRCWMYHLQKMDKDVNVDRPEWLAEFLSLLKKSEEVAATGNKRAWDKEL